MLKAWFLLIPVLCCGQLAAQGFDALSDARKAVAFDPGNDGKRLDLAWNLMLDGQYEEALTHYRLVISRDSANADAATGILWSLSAQNRYKELVREADTLLETQAGTGSLYYYRGLARLNLGKANRARLDARQGLALARDGFWRDLAAKVLSDSYLALDDVPAATATMRKYSPQNEPPKAPRSLAIELTGGAKGDSTYIAAAGLKAALGPTRLGLTAEELRLGDQHYRWMFQVSGSRQFRYLDLIAELNWLEGEDARIYPAQGFRLGLLPKIYAGPLIVRPRFSQSVLVTQRLNSYQSDAGLKLLLPPFSVSYSLAWIYLDKESVDADSSDLAHSADLAISLTRGWELGFYGGTGAMAFHSTPYGGVIDDFEPELSYAGASLYAPLGKHFGLLLYGQLGFNGDNSTPFYYLRGSYRV